jgi:hypothetical protein
MLFWETNAPFAIFLIIPKVFYLSAIQYNTEKGDLYLGRL